MVFWRKYRLQVRDFIQVFSIVAFVSILVHDNGNGYDLLLIIIGYNPFMDHPVGQILNFKNGFRSVRDLGGLDMGCLMV
ncbi:hypothetical protein M3182_03015 [Mesobacillus maritimus]|uniref:hypothetical protein n=1 Tax=Mesobacillus maritimus TaxID=1643336 RepID=UPI0020415E06|nr:hypothetical protein [Mesobacillus maritimus]MCM3584715.1 hypothetical protein [Mesobacillus maritimus]